MSSKQQSEPSMAGEHARAFGSTMGEIWKSMAGLKLPTAAINEMQADYLRQAAALWNESLKRRHDGADGSGRLADRRFSHEDWARSPAAAFAAQVYLLNARTLMQMAESVEGDEKTKGRIRFAVQQWIEAASPSNYLALNPEAQRLALETKGESITKGMLQLFSDLQKGRVSQTDESVFEVGRNVATTEGSVVFENELFQLIEYRPLTATVHERPALFVPPCINKYYIMDLQPDNSLIRFVVEQGHRLFVISWRNPDQSLAGKTWDDYIADGAIKAIDVVRGITGAKALNTLGFCVGGTIIATVLAVLAARGQRPAQSLTLLTTLLDFSDAGMLDLFIDEPSVRLREMTIGAGAPNGPDGSLPP